MGITKERREVSPGVIKESYTVFAEGINKYTGKRVQKKCRGVISLPKAERIYKQLWSQCKEERPDGPPIKTWGELKSSYFHYIDENIRSLENPNGFSPKAAVSRKSRFVHLKHWDSLHLDLITAHFVRSELDTLEASGVASRELTAEIQKEAKCLMNYGVDRGTFKVSPLIALKKRSVSKKKKNALNHEEVKIFLREAKLRSHPYYFIWLLTLTLGLRRSELAGVKWSDIDFENRLLYLQRQQQPHEGIVEMLKGKKDRTVAIPNYVIPVLKEHRPKAKTPFVIEVDCQKWEMGHQALVTREFCREIGIKEVTFHELRATHITLALIDGVPIGIVKENVGHAKLSTTDGYFRSSGVQLRGQTDGLKISIPLENEEKNFAA